MLKGDKILGSNAAKLRKLVNMSQSEASRALGVSSSFLGHVEVGVRSPSSLLLRKMMKLYKTSADELLGVGPGARVQCPHCDGKGWTYDERAT